MIVNLHLYCYTVYIYFEKCANKNKATEPDGVKTTHRPDFSCVVVSVYALLSI